MANTQKEIDAIEVINSGAIKLKCNIKREFIRTTVGALMGLMEGDDERNVAFKINHSNDKVCSKFLGKELIINPEHQRGYVWKDWIKQGLVGSVVVHRDINTISLVQYTDENGKVIDDSIYECLNGQQRLVTIGKFLTNKLSVLVDGFGTPMTWNTLKGIDGGMYNRQFLECPVSVIILRGIRSDIMEEWKIVNIPAEKHSDQEIRNGCYGGSYNNRMREQFASGTGNIYMERFGCGDVNRQGQTETAYCWLSCGTENNKNKQNALIDAYMQKTIGDTTTTSEFYEDMKVIRDIGNWYQKWTKPLKDKCYNSVIGLGRKIAVLYHLYKDRPILPEKEIVKFVNDKLQKIAKFKAGKITGEENNLDITDIKDIMEELISGKKVVKSIEFSEEVKLAVYTMNDHKCGHCGLEVPFEDAHYHHLNPKMNGGRGNIENCVLLHASCHDHVSTTVNMQDPASFPYSVNINR